MRAVLLTLVLLLPAMASAATDVQGSVPGNTAVSYTHLTLPTNREV